MTELTGLELRRKACEAIGWKRARDGDGWWHSSACRTDQSGHRDYTSDLCDYSSHRLEKDLPAIESDPAVSEPMFLEWCKSHHYWWNTGSGYVEDGCKYYYCSVGEFRTGNAYTLSNVEGATPSEARARAIVEAGSN